MESNELKQIQDMNFDNVNEYYQQFLSRKDDLLDSINTLQEDINNRKNFQKFYIGEDKDGYRPSEQMLIDNNGFCWFVLSQEI